MKTGDVALTFDNDHGATVSIEWVYDDRDMPTPIVVIKSPGSESGDEPAYLTPDDVERVLKLIGQLPGMP